MKRALAALAVALVIAPLAARAQDSGLEMPSRERVVFHTIAGDLVFVLFPKAAPKTVEQFLKLVRAGVYDTTAFVRVEPGFVIQISDAADRTVPFTAAQKALIHDLPDEFNAIKHVRGVLSMAHWDKPNSGQTSFSILLGAAPHLDGKFTAFGRLESGFQVLDEMLQVPRDGNKPKVRIEVTKASVIPTAAALAQIPLASARPIPYSGPMPSPAPTPAEAAAVAPAASDPGSQADTALLGGILLILVVGLASFFLQGRVPATVHASLNLVTVLIAMFLLMLAGLPLAQRKWPFAIVLFFGLIGVLKVLGRFETAVERK